MMCPSFLSRSVILILLFSCTLEGYSQLTLTASSGTASGSFSTLKAAFEAINAGTHQGSIVININASTTETASAVLNASGSGSCSYTSISIYPTTTGLSISGDLATPLIDLNGADNVTIDGRVNATGSTKSLTISNASNSSTAGTSTIRFINDATSNTITYCTLKGSATVATSGIVFFSTGAGVTGNDNNTIDHNDITCADDTKRPLNALYALGSSNNYNETNTISNNNIFNFLSRTTPSNGISISSYNKAYSISGNSFYETAAFAATASVIYNVILINATAGTENGFTVSGNYIGGSEALCGSTAWTKTGSNNNAYAISVTTAAGTANSIQGNTIKNISWSNTGASSFWGIHLSTATDANIGTITGNTIGAATGTGSIQFTGDNGSSFLAINMNTSGTVDCRNNTVGSITAACVASTGNTTFYGINKTALAGSVTINGNTIGSTTTAGSITASSASTTSAQSVFGIRSIGTGLVTISGNTVVNLVNATSNATVGVAGQVSGIFTQSGTMTISGNTVRDLSIANANNVITYNAAVIGIALSSLPMFAHTVSGNTVYNLSNTNAGFGGAVIGIFYGGPAVASTMSRNFIHSLSVTGASSTAAKLYGIKINAGASTYSNNIISLGGDTKTDVYGIYETGGSSNNNSLYFNTIYISGSLVSGATNVSYAVYSAVNTNSRDFRNNVLVNARSTASGASKHYALYAATGGTITCDYNNYYVSGTGGVLGYYGADKTSLPIVTGQDANSIATNPTFVSTGTSSAGYVPTVTGTGVSGTGITVDFNGITRSTPLTMGALASLCTNPTGGGTIAAAQSGLKPFDPVAFTNSAAASGETGTIEYKWQSSTTSSSEGFSDIASINTATYDPTALTQTTWFKRLARVGCKSDWTGAAESNVLEMTVVSTLTWNGSVSTDWTTAANWTPIYAPNSSVHIIIPSSATRLPASPATATLNQLTVETGLTLTLGTAEITLTGNLANNGTLTNTSGKLILAGASAQTISGTGTITNLEINNNAGVTISSGAGHMQTVTGMLVPTAGTLNTNGHLTLKSDASGTARVMAFSGSSSIIGDVIAERYVPQNAISGGTGRAWRLVSIPVTGTGNLRDFFMNGRSGQDLTQTSVVSAESANSGTPIVGHNYATATDANNAGFDWIGVPNQVSSLRSYVGNASGGSFLSQNVPSMATAFNDAAQGYMVYVRGDRMLTFPSTNSAAATTFRSTGALKTGNQPVNVATPSTSKYTLVGNPYMSTLDLSLLYADNSSVINPSFWIWDANMAGTQKQGGFVNVFKSGSSWVTNTGTYTNPERIESGVAFFVEPVSGLASATDITIREAHKSNVVTAGMMPLATALEDDHGRMFVRLETADSLGRRQVIDGVMVDFHKSFRSSLVDMSDRDKMRNTISQGGLWLNTEQHVLSSEGLPWPDTTKCSLHIYMAPTAGRQMNLKVDPRGLEKINMKAWLKDHHLGTESVIDMSKGLDYVFTGIGSASLDSTRFEIVYRMAKTSTSGTSTPDDVTETPSVKLYPNPARASDMKLSLRAITPGTYTIQVLDLSGRLVAVKSIQHGSAHGEYPVMEGLRLSSGQYIIRLMNADRQIQDTLRMMVE